MRLSKGWARVMAAGLVTLSAPALHAASSSKTVGVVIIMPERTDLAESEPAAGAPADPLGEPLRTPPGRGMVRTTTLVPGDGGWVLVTDVPEL